MRTRGDGAGLLTGAYLRGRRPSWPLLALALAVSTLAGACATQPPIDTRSVTPAQVSITPQRDWSDAILYFVLLDRFADGDGGNNANLERRNPGGWHGGDLRGLTAQLDEIADLGATAIWINPIVQQIRAPLWAGGPPGSQWQDGFEHWPFHGYWADDFGRLDPHFGSEADLKALVDAAHARGIKVLLDVVYNHVGYGSAYLSNPQTRDWFRARQTECEVDPLICQVGGLPDLRTELPEVREHLFDAHLGLARRTGIDGFRLDTVKHVEHDFWQAHRARTRAELGDDFFLLGEVWGGSAEALEPWFAPDEIDAGFDFTFKGSCQSFVEGKGRSVAFASYLSKRHRVREGHQLVHYLSSHDEPMALHELGDDVSKLKLCVALQMTSTGIPMIYYGEEVGRRGGAWPDNRNDMPWGGHAVLPGKGADRDDGLREYYRKLIAVRRAHPALRSGTFRPLATDGDLLVFLREDGDAGDAVIVAVNRGAQTATATVPLPSGWRVGAARELLGGEHVAVGADGLPLSIAGRTAQIYVGAE